jgi:hypothetical protein
MSDDDLRRVYGLGPRIEPEPVEPSPLWLAIQQAREEFRVAYISFANQEATEAQLLAAARRLRSLQEQQWPRSAASTTSPSTAQARPAAQPHHRPAGQSSVADSTTFPRPPTAGTGNGPVEAAARRLANPWTGQKRSMS